MRGRLWWTHLSREYATLQLTFRQNWPLIIVFISGLIYPITASRPGWGQLTGGSQVSQSRLQAAEVNLTSIETCKKELRDNGHANYASAIEEDGDVCAGGPGEADACQ